jgi:hypothetical protein
LVGADAGLPDELLENVFQRQNATGLAVLVDDAGQV